MGNTRQTHHQGQIKTLDGEIVKPGDRVYRWLDNGIKSDVVYRLQLFNGNSILLPSVGVYSSATAIARAAIRQCLHFVSADDLRRMIDELDLPRS